MQQTRISRPHVDWAKDANIYEVNIRQYSPEGTFAAFRQHLLRLRAMGVDILWLMPIQPPGVKNRKGSYGSPYSLRDYFSVNPDYGTLDEFKDLVDEVHGLGMHILIDWVANHTGWDHPWVNERPEWYKKNENGEICSYEYDNGREIEHWTDAVGLDYDQASLWPEMIEALSYWVRETDIDGYRCDVAGLVPTAFWEQARDALDRIKPVFMLAEWSEPELHRSAFDMTYDWALHDVIREIARGEGDVGDLLSYLDEPIPPFPPDAYRMQFTSNHDKNAWEGSDTELFGESLPVFAVIAATLPGMPLLYGGQESRLDKRLPLFEKDSIEWHDFPLAPLYSELFRLKHENPVLWNGAHGAPVDLLPCRTRDVFAFRRAAPGNEVTVVANLSGKEQTVKLEDQVKKLHLGPWCWWIDERH